MQNIPLYYIVYIYHMLLFLHTVQNCVFSEYCDAFLLRQKKCCVWQSWTTSLKKKIPDTVVLVLSGFQLFYGTLREESHEDSSVVSKNAFSVDW